MKRRIGIWLVALTVMLTACGNAGTGRRDPGGCLGDGGSTGNQKGVVRGGEAD